MLTTQVRKQGPWWLVAQGKALFLVVTLVLEVIQENCQKQFFYCQKSLKKEKTPYIFIILCTIQCPSLNASPSKYSTKYSSDIILYECYIQALANAVLLVQESKEGNVLFNDTLNIFYFRLYGIRYMVKGHSDRERKPATWATLSN